MIIDLYCFYCCYGCILCKPLFYTAHVILGGNNGSKLVYGGKSGTFVIINPFFQIDCLPIRIIIGKHSVNLLDRLRECNLDSLVVIVYDFQMM